MEEGKKKRCARCGVVLTEYNASLENLKKDGGLCRDCVKEQRMFGTFYVKPDDTELLKNRRRRKKEEENYFYYLKRRIYNKNWLQKRRKYVFGMSDEEFLNFIDPYLEEEEGK
ncbi:hypothetical protein DMB44_05425 [Thermoplasma sp. Kam2015]|uniref:hypothetical protein n=1 Tax=Thermoplasma sp. Kam2015 TaxID=2094122 RepID=UPI000D91BC0E|nr:hypothetical protein [Thermoplasma sp. Kam2015]PYB68162.1 hypothetical protein DMB44_05425 [Thermoplasma sp. Kam2015]